MTSLLFLALILVATIILFFIFASIFHIITKLFKIEKANYKTALKLYLLATLILGAVGLVLSIIQVAGIIINIITLMTGFFVFHELLKKYYNTVLKKNILIYITFTIITTILSLSIIIPIRSQVMLPFYTKGAAMEPTFGENEYMMIKMFDKEYERGDIIVHKYPNDPQQYFIKRIIGLPGETIKLKDGEIYIYNDDNKNGFKLNEPYLSPEIKTYSSINTLELGTNEYYVLGDNRKKSRDSRSFGAVNKDLIIGKYWFSPFKKNK